MSAFAPLLEELDRWQAAGRTANLWLRDDDAAEPSPALEELLKRASASGVPIVVAAVPMLATEALAARLASMPLVTVWQHGISHGNNAWPWQKKRELASNSAAMRAGLQQAWDRLSHLFGAQARPVLVPPWNRIAPELIRHLPQIGFSGISIFKARTSAEAAPGLWQVNAHIDLIEWNGGRKFIGISKACEGIAGHLAAKRTGVADPAEPTGVLTHHLVMEESAWDFLSALFALTHTHPAARWCVPNPGTDSG